MSFYASVFVGELWTSDGQGQQGTTEEELVGEVPCTTVIGEVIDEGTHVTLSVVGYAPCRAIDVGQETIAQADGLFDGVERGFAFLSKLINLARSISTVTAEDGAEEAELHPTDIKFLIVGVVGCITASIATAEEASDVGVDIGTTRHGIVEAEGYLLA